MKDSLGALLVGTVVFGAALALLFYERGTSNGSSHLAGKPVVKKPSPPSRC